MTQALEEIEESLDKSGIRETMGPLLDNLSWGRVLSTAVLIVVCIAVVKVLQRLFQRILERGTVEKSLHSFLRNSVNILLWTVTVLVVVSSLGVDVTSLIAVLSIAGLAVSLAIQESLANLAGGIQILTSKPFKVGDFVEADGTSGTVQEIGMVHTRLITVDNKMVCVPNRELAGAKIVNYTAQAVRRVDLVFSASYDDGTQQVIAAIEAVIQAHPLALQDPPAFVRLSAYGESCIEYTARVWCATGDYWTVYHDMLEQVRASFDRFGITMTYPHMNVHIVEEGDRQERGKL